MWLHLVFPRHFMTRIDVIFAVFQSTRRSPSDSLQSSNFQVPSLRAKSGAQQLPLDGSQRTPPSSISLPMPQSLPFALGINRKRKKASKLVSVRILQTGLPGESFLGLSILELWLLRRRGTGEVDNGLFSKKPSGLCCGKCVTLKQGKARCGLES